VPATNDAWAWMSGVANEHFIGDPKTDNDFSKILTGQ
jgi:hypothetical protein